jgi:hypothetical protein
LPPLLLQRKFRAVLERLQLPQQRQAIDEERAAGLPTAEVMQQLDRAPAPDAKDTLEHRPVYNRHFHCCQFRSDLRKSK